MLYLAKETYESAYEAGPATTVTAAVGLYFLVRYMLKKILIEMIDEFCVSKA